MSSDRSRVKVGLVLPQAPEDGDGGSWAEIAELARRAEDAAADSLWLCDHFFSRDRDGREIGYHEAWTLLSALAAVTTRVELGTLVVATSFRSPGILAKMAATADAVSDGRLILGLGCGWYEPEYRAFGYPFDHRVSRFEETLQVLVPLVRGERVTFSGSWTQAEDAFVRPPLRRPAIPIVIAAEQPRMMRLAARFADGWQTAWYGLPDKQFESARREFRAACLEEGRDERGVETLVGVAVDEIDDGGRPDPQSLPLDAVAVADALSAWADEGVTHVQLGLAQKTLERWEVLLEGIAQYAGAARDGARAPDRT